MLLTELYHLIFERTDLNQTNVAWIKPSTGKVLSDPNVDLHLLVLLQHPEEFGVDPIKVRADIDKNFDGYEKDWADEYDEVFGPYHMAAYKNGWIRWRIGIYRNDVYLSGLLPDVKECLVSYDVIQFFKFNLQSDRPPIRIVIDYIDQGGEQWASEEVSNMVEFQRFVRSLS